MTTSTSPADQLTTIRQVVARWIMDSYADPAGVPAAGLAALNAVGDAATALHESLAAAGIDLAPELDALADTAATKAFDSLS